MTQDYGKQIMLALRAVEQLHSDCSKLLVDFDKKMAGWSSVFSNYATRDLTYNVRADRWMAEGVYRFYYHKPQPATVRAVTISFTEAKSEEPLLLVGEIEYAGNPTDVKAVCKEWDLWGAYFDWNPQRTYDEVISLAYPDPGQRIESARLIAMPLYSIESLDEVYGLMQRVARSAVTKN